MFRISRSRRHYYLASMVSGRFTQAPLHVYTAQSDASGSHDDTPHGAAPSANPRFPSPKRGGKAPAACTVHRPRPDTRVGVVSYMVRAKYLNLHHPTTAPPLETTMDGKVRYYIASSSPLRDGRPHNSPRPHPTRVKEEFFWSE